MRRYVISVCTVLSLLFWMIAIQNPLEKNPKPNCYRFNIFNISYPVCCILGELVGLSYFNWLIIDWLKGTFLSLATILTLLIIVRIFERRVTKALKIFMGIYVVLYTISNLLPQAMNSLLSTILIVGVIPLNIYYIISSWKNLRGPQWAICGWLNGVFIFRCCIFIYRNTVRPPKY